MVAREAVKVGKCSVEQVAVPHARLFRTPQRQVGPPVTVERVPRVEFVPQTVHVEHGDTDRCRIGQHLAVELFFQLMDVRGLRPFAPPHPLARLRPIHHRVHPVVGRIVQHVHGRSTRSRDGGAGRCPRCRHDCSDQQPTQQHRLPFPLQLFSSASVRCGRRSSCRRRRCRSSAVRRSSSPRRQSRGVGRVVASMVAARRLVSSLVARRRTPTTQVRSPEIKKHESSRRQKLNSKKRGSPSSRALLAMSEGKF